MEKWLEDLENDPEIQAEIRFGRKQKEKQAQCQHKDTIPHRSIVGEGRKCTICGLFIIEKRNKY